MSDQVVVVRVHDAVGRGQWLEIEVEDTDGRPISRQTVWADRIVVEDQRVS